MCFAHIAISGEIISSGTFETLLLEVVFEKLTVPTARKKATATETLRSEIIGAIREGRPAEFYRRDASGEGFKDLEFFCRQVGLSYRRTLHGTDIPGPSVAYWQPGLDDAIVVTADQQGQPSVPVEVLDELFSQPNADWARVDALLGPYRLAAGREMPAALTVGQLVPAEKLEA